MNESQHQGLSSVEPEEYANQGDGGKESVGKLIVAGGGSAVLLELVEEALDEIALTVEGEIGFCAPRDDWLSRG